jgi:hypothetical protein
MVSALISHNVNLRDFTLIVGHVIDLAVTDQPTFTKDGFELFLRKTRWQAANCHLLRL